MASLTPCGDELSAHGVTDGQEVCVLQSMVAKSQDSN